MNGIMEGLSHSITSELELHKQPDKLKGRDKLLGAEYISLGIPLVDVRKLVVKIYSEQIHKYEQNSFLSIAEELLSSDVYEKKMAGIFLLGKYVKDKHVIPYEVLEELIKTYVNEWSLCDTFATEVLAPSLLRNWENGKNILHSWSNSTNMWIRRSALVGVIKCKQGSKDWHKFAHSLVSIFSTEKESQVNKAKKWLVKEIQKGDITNVE